MASTAEPARDADQRERARQPGLDEPEAARRDRDLRQHLGGAEGEQHEPGARLRADRGQRGQQRRVVERPAAAGRRQRALPARAEVPTIRVRSRSRRSGSRRDGSARRRSRLRTRWTTRPTQASGPSKAISTVPIANSATSTTRPMTVGSTRRRLTPPRRIAGTASTGMARTTAKTSRLAAVRPGDRAVGGQPGLDEHPVLQRGAERAAAGRDLRQRVARQLRADDGRPRRPAHGQVLERPQARERQRLQAGHRGQPPRGQLVEVVPRAEDVDQARRDEVERDAGHREPEHGPAQPAARGGSAASPRSISCSTSARWSIARSTRSPIWVIAASLRAVGHARPYGAPG